MGANSLDVGANAKTGVGAIHSDVGAKGTDVQVAPLILPSPGSMYRFANVGAVFVIFQSDKSRLVSTFTDENGNQFDVPIAVPGGNWLLVSVGDITGLEKPGFAKVDNPYPTSQ